MSNETQPQKSANIYELMQRFWRENEYKPFSTAAIAHRRIRAYKRPNAPRVEHSPENLTPLLF